MAWSKPLTPPLRGIAPNVVAAPAAAEPAEADCTTFECDQCGRPAMRPHGAGGRIFCRSCCPTCARIGAAVMRRAR